MYALDAHPCIPASVRPMSKVASQMFCVCATGLVVVALRTTREAAFRSGVQAGVLLLLTAMTGGAGLALIPPVGAWLLYLAVVGCLTGIGFASVYIARQSVVSWGSLGYALFFLALYVAAHIVARMTVPNAREESLAFMA